jgi:2,3-bisphosphoglycerate-independent phosphoglycerate mutase
VPVFLTGVPEGSTLRDGRLADIAPTLLGLMRLPQPAEMSGQTLLDGPVPTKDAAHPAA